MVIRRMQHVANSDEDITIAPEYRLSIAILNTYKIDFDKELKKGNIGRCKALIKSFRTHPLVTFFDDNVIKYIIENLEKEIENHIEKEKKKCHSKE